ncbi:hypothetical protein [Chitinophaga dinghuensis]|nr:hypothetical protein [Chitinophaga dinghuensis]
MMKAEGNIVPMVMSQIKKGESYAEVESIIQNAVSTLSEPNKLASLEKLHAELDAMNPLDFNSTEWNACRYARMYLRTQMAEAI